MRARRKHSREFKVEAVRLVRERGVTVAQVARDLDLSQTLVRKRVRQFVSDPKQAFPGQGQQKPEDAELTRRRARSSARRRSTSRRRTRTRTATPPGECRRRARR